MLRVCCSLILSVTGPAHLPSLRGDQGGACWEARDPDTLETVIRVIIFALKKQLYFYFLFLFFCTNVKFFLQMLLPHPGGKLARMAAVIVLF